MEKYDLLFRQLVLEGIVEDRTTLNPKSIDLEHVLRVHDTNYFTKLKTLNCTPREQRVSGFVHNDQLIERELTIMEGTRLCAEIALNHGAAFNIAGGTHHAYSNRGEGFCLLNDQAIAAEWLLHEKLTDRIAIIDLDVHQGNGTAELFAGRKDVFTFSMHGSSNYPLKKEVSHWDIALKDHCGDQEYLSLLEGALQKIKEDVAPTFIFYQSGVDVLASDSLGKLGLTLEGCAKRDHLVYEWCNAENLPVVSTMGGGYSKDVRTIVEAHTRTFRTADYFFGC